MDAQHPLLTAITSRSFATISPTLRWTWFTWDPPFNSNASYNVRVLSRSPVEDSPAQIKAFTDTWEWTLETERTFEQDIILHPGDARGGQWI